MHTNLVFANILISNKNLFEYVSEGFTNEVHLGSDNDFEPTKKQAINSLALARSRCYCKNTFFLNTSRFADLVSSDFLMIMPSDAMGPNWW